jgi:hypothetical protein
MTIDALSVLVFLFFTTWENELRLPISQLTGTFFGRFSNDWYFTLIRFSGPLVNRLSANE